MKTSTITSHITALRERLFVLLALRTKCNSR